MIKQAVAILFFCVCLADASAQEGYFVSFSDKNNTPYSLDRPEEFLSARAIERRQRQNISLIESDLPVNPHYIDSLKQAGIDVRHTTKWLNGAILFCANTALMDTLTRISFIASVEKTKPSNELPSSRHKFETSYPSLKKTSSSFYGASHRQLGTVNGHHLHEKGYRGEGMQIAVIDAGFFKADNLPLFSHLWQNGQILGSKDFVDPLSNIFTTHSHGMHVLSIMAGNQDGIYRGASPDASYWLLRTEDAASEHPIEADYWICAAEFADSAGADVVNTSLGYYEFDPPSSSYAYTHMDGSTRISQACDIASSKGMLMVTSAGNEGASSWHYIGAPADARYGIAVGAITADSTRASFSSFGPSYDGRIKPDVSALGDSVAVQGTRGSISYGNGTSFAAPIISGLAACLWQAMPHKNAAEIRQLIIESAHQANAPNNALGYGIPNFRIALFTDIKQKIQSPARWKVAVNPFGSQLKLIGTGKQPVSIAIYDILGNLMYYKDHPMQEEIIINEVAHMANGIYLVIIENSAIKQHIKVIKNR
ncbi:MULTISPECIES: S8 family serine peptidase [unclassified Carboxylicivirga]|uniref:S8 family serine peptidase n=1 Tax=Carboxylicivirga TaxID=1628153 RepID=UPI003D335673